MLLLKRIISLTMLMSVSYMASAQMPRMELTAGFFRIDVEVAANNDNRMKGLMHRKSMPINKGMLFVFTFSERHCMWMKNTLIPLSVAFMDSQGVILNIEDMEAQTEDNHCAAGHARYALEMNKGWFAEKGIEPGMRIRGIEKAPRPQ